MTALAAPAAVGRAPAGTLAGGLWALRQLGLFAAYLGLAWLLFAPVTIWHDHTFLAHSDGTNQTYAWTTALFRALDAGKIPLWDFTAFSGTSLIGELQPAVLYPLNFLLHLLAAPGDQQAVDDIVVLHIALSAWLMHGYLRVLGCRTAAAAAGALTFAFMGSLVRQAVTQPNIHAGLAWLPLVFTLATLAWRAAATLDRLFWTVLAGMALGTMVLAGHMQPYLQAALALAVCAVLTQLGGPERRRAWLRALTVLAVIAAASALFAAVPLWFGREYLRLAYRFYGDGVTTYPHVVPWPEYAWHWVIRPDQLYLLLFPDYWSFDEPNRIHVGRVALALAVIGAWVPRREARFAAVLAVGAVLLAMGGWTPLGWITYHLPLLSSMREPSRYLYLFSFGAAVLAAFGFDRVVDWTRHAAWPERAIAPLALALLVGEVVHYDGYVSIARGPLDPGTYYNTAIARRLSELDRQDGGLYRIWVEPPDLVPPNLGDVRPARMARGYRATIYRPYADYLSDHPDLAGPGFDRLGVRYTVTPQPVPGLIERARIDGLVLSERPHALPVFWMAAPDGSARPVKIEQVRWGVDQVAVDLDSPPAGTLVFAQPDYPGWRVRVDGALRPLAKVDIFQAVRLAGGEHTVKFEYRPRALPILYAVMLSVPLLAVALAALRRRRSLTPLPSQG